MEDLFHAGPPVAGPAVGAGDLQRLGDVPPLAHARRGRQRLHAVGELAVGPVVLEVPEQLPVVVVDGVVADPGVLDGLLDLRPQLDVDALVLLQALLLEADDRAQPLHVTSTPPSTGKACPVMDAASSEHRYSAMVATSSGLPMRPMGWYACSFWSISSSLPG